MKKSKGKELGIVEMKNFLSYDEKIEEKTNTFEKIMTIYEMAIEELETKISILQKEFKVFYNYDLIDHVNTRIKEPASILNKMNKKGYELTYKEMIENINDIAGVRIICQLKDDIFKIRNLIEKVPGINIEEEKDYVNYPKESGYSSYHMIVEVPVTLSKQIIYESFFKWFNILFVSLFLISSAILGFNLSGIFSSGSSKIFNLQYLLNLLEYSFIASFK